MVVSTLIGVSIIVLVGALIWLLGYLSGYVLDKVLQKMETENWEPRKLFRRR